MASVKKPYDERIDLFGNEIESFNQNPEYNHFAIYDVDGDGTDELILSWGDSFVAGFIHGLSKGLSLQDSCRYGCAVSSVVVEHMGTQNICGISNEAEKRYKS